MTARFVSFQAIFQLIHAENEKRTVHHLDNKTVPFPNVQQPNDGLEISAAPTSLQRANTL